MSPESFYLNPPWATLDDSSSRRGYWGDTGGHWDTGTLGTCARHQKEEDDHHGLRTSALGRPSPGPLHTSRCTLTRTKGLGLTLTPGTPDVSLAIHRRGGGVVCHEMPRVRYGPSPGQRIHSPIPVAPRRPFLCVLVSEGPTVGGGGLRRTRSGGSERRPASP